MKLLALLIFVVVGCKQTTQNPRAGKASSPAIPNKIQHESSPQTPIELSELEELASEILIEESLSNEELEEKISEKNNLTSAKLPDSLEKLFKLDRDVKACPFSKLTFYPNFPFV